MNLDSVRLHLELTSPGQETATDSPSQDVQDEGDVPERCKTEDEFDAFRRVEAAGLPGDWFEQNLGEPWGFQLIIDDKRRRVLALEALNGVLECIAKDLHDLGADESQSCCQCERQATTLGYFETMSEGPLIAPYCNGCWEETQQATQGVIRTGEPNNLLRGWIFLVIATVVFAAIWGCSQYPEFGVPFHLLFIGCAGAGIAMAIATTWFAQGSNLVLRLAVAAGVMAATLAGNIMGVKFLVEAQGLVISWPRIILAYFVEYFPTHVGQELLFLSCGVVGVLIGFFLMRESERIRLR